MDIYCDFNTAATQRNGHYKLSGEKEQLRTQLLSNIRLCLSYLLPRGVFRGDKFYVGDVQGNRGKSLVVELAGGKVGIWHDFATVEGGDIFDLWAAVNGKNQFTDTVEDIAKWLGYSREHRTMLGQPTASWNYYDENNQVIAKVYRYDTPSEKRYLPFDVKKSSFTAPEIRPLYNIPGIMKSAKVILVEGEKCAEVLIEQGITATTAMSGANAPLDKTDWSPLKGKHVTIWPDNDAPGKQYAEKVAKKLMSIGVLSLNVLKISQDKPKNWDVADCAHEGIDIKEFLASTIHITYTKNLVSFPAQQYLNDTSPMPEDIIAPRILTPSGLLVFAGAPKVGKSDFLISWLFHMAAGIPFLDMVPKRPLKIFYLQTEVAYHYMRERLQQLKIDQKLLELAGKNLVITPQTKLLLNENGVDDVFNEIKKSFDPSTIDIIAIDPLRNIFDAGENGNENDNSYMLFFLQERVERLRTLVNPDSGIILVHHTKKVCKKQLEEDPFQSLSGAGSLRSFYTTGMVMFRPDEQQSNRQLIFELRNGHAVEQKCIDKINNSWCILSYESQRLVNKDYGQKLDGERFRRNDTILQLIDEEARKGKLYTTNLFCQVFENKAGLGSQHSIRDSINVLAAKGDIKFYRENTARSKYGLLCIENMVKGEEVFDCKTNKQTMVYKKILPTHYKSPQYGNVIPVENPNIWVHHFSS